MSIACSMSFLLFTSSRCWWMPQSAPLQQSVVFLVLHTNQRLVVLHCLESFSAARLHGREKSLCRAERVERVESFPIHNNQRQLQTGDRLSSGLLCRYWTHSAVPAVDGQEVNVAPNKGNGHYWMVDHKWALPNLGKLELHFPVLGNWFW